MRYNTVWIVKGTDSVHRWRQPATRQRSFRGIFLNRRMQSHIAFCTVALHLAGVVDNLCFVYLEKVIGLFRRISNSN